MENGSQAAIDLGIIPPSPDDRSLAAFQTKALSLLVDMQLAHGSAKAASIFDLTAALARGVARERRARTPVSRKPPRKRKGAAHDPSGDANLLALWKHTPYTSKYEFARELINRKLVRTVAPASLIRRLDRLLAGSGRD